MGTHCQKMERSTSLFLPLLLLVVVFLQEGLGLKCWHTGKTTAGYALVTSERSAQVPILEKSCHVTEVQCERSLHGQPDIRRLLQAWLFPSEPKIVAEKGGKLNKGDRLAQPSLLQRGLLQHTTLLHHHLHTGSLAKGGLQGGRYTPGWFSKDAGHDSYPYNCRYYSHCGNHCMYFKEMNALLIMT